MQCSCKIEEVGLIQKEKKASTAHSPYVANDDSEKRSEAECDSAGTLLATIQPRVGGIQPGHPATEGGDVC